MTCDQVRPLLEAFTTHELGWGTAWRVRRHLTACPDCVPELAATRLLDAQVRAWRDVPAPAGLHRRIAAALPSPSPVAVPRRPAVVRRAVAGLAGVAAASAAFFWLVPGQPGRPTLAFADVEQAMQQVQVVSYDMNSHVYDAGGHAIPSVMSFSFHNWLRRTPAASARYDVILRERELEDVRGTIWYDQRLNKYWEQPPAGDIEQSINKYIRRLTEPPTEAVPEELRSANNFHVQPWQRQEITMGGQNCLMFTQDSDRTVVTGDGGTASQLTRITIWVDAQTLHIIRIEAAGNPTQNVAVNGNEGVVERTVFDHFHYNEAPPPGVFDWSPPPGAKVEGHW